MVAAAAAISAVVPSMDSVNRTKTRTEISSDHPMNDRLMAKIRSMTRMPNSSLRFMLIE